MPPQQQQSQLAKRFASRLTKAYKETKEKPVNLGRQQLPAGIKDGRAKLKTAYIAFYKDDVKEAALKGQEYFRASGVVITPKEFNGQTCEGMQTSVMIPLCDVPEKGKRKFKSLEAHYDDYQNWFKMFGIAPPDIDPEAPGGAAAIFQYYNAACVMLLDPKNPQYFKFSTRGWTPPATADNPKPDEMIFEEWHGKVADVLNGEADAGVDDSTGGPAAEMNAEEPFVEPPMGGAEEPAAETDADLEGLIAIADGDPTGTTPEGKAAIAKITQMGVDAGIAVETINEASSWSDVAGMIAEAGAEPTAPADPVVGAVYSYKKRDAKGNPMKNKAGAELNALHIEILSVNATAKTVTAKTQDGKTVIDAAKKPVQIKWEYLE